MIATVILEQSKKLKNDHDIIFNKLLSTRFLCMEFLTVRQ